MSATREVCAAPYEGQGVGFSLIEGEAPPKAVVRVGKREAERPKQPYFAYGSCRPRITIYKGGASVTYDDTFPLIKWEGKHHPSPVLLRNPPSPQGEGVEGNPLRRRGGEGGVGFSLIEGEAPPKAVVRVGKREAERPKQPYFAYGSCRPRITIYKGGASVTYGDTFPLIKWEGKYHPSPVLLRNPPSPQGEGVEGNHPLCPPPPRLYKWQDLRRHERNARSKAGDTIRTRSGGRHEKVKRAGVFYEKMRGGD